MPASHALPGLDLFHRCKLNASSAIWALILSLIFQQFIHNVQARGGGSKRTFGSPKSQGSQNQNLAECNDQLNCPNEASDPSWMSVLGATMALVGPLLVLLAFIVMIKLCLVHLYPEGYHNQENQGEDTAARTIKLEIGSPDEKILWLNAANLSADNAT